MDVKAVAKGLKWLAKQQRADGSWSDTNNVYPTYMTANAAAALLMEGSTLTRGTYAPNLRKALAWVEKTAAADGRICGTGGAENAWDVSGHADALVFLVCIYDVDDDEPRRERVAKLIDRAIAFLVDCQGDSGGWGFASGDKSNAKSWATIAALQGLFAARKAGFTVPKRTIERAVGYLVEATSNNGGVRFNVASADNTSRRLGRGSDHRCRRRVADVRRAAAGRAGAVGEESTGTEFATAARPVYQSERRIPTV